jgi:hypothetical protein
MHDVSWPLPTLEIVSRLGSHATRINALYTRLTIHFQRCTHLTLAQANCTSLAVQSPSIGRSRSPGAVRSVDAERGHECAGLPVMMGRVIVHPRRRAVARQNRPERRLLGHSGDTRIYFIEAAYAALDFMPLSFPR